MMSPLKKIGNVLALWALGSLLFSLASCAHLSKSGTTEVGDVPKVLEQFWKGQELRRKELATVEGKLRVEWNLKNQTLLGTGRLLSVARGLRLELRDPLGRLQFQITMKGEQFTAYIPSQRLAYLDSHRGRAYVKEFLNLDLDFTELSQLWLGILNVEWKQAKWEASAVKQTAQSVWIPLSLEGRQLKLEVSKDGSSLLKIIYESGDSIFELGFEDFATCCGNINEANLSIAHSVLSRDASPQSNQNGKKGGEVELEWLEIRKGSAPQGEVPFDAKIPSGVEKRTLK